MEERKYADLRIDVDQDDKLATEATIDGDKITPPENYLIGKITKVDNGMLVEFVRKQPHYLKTYEECCEVLGCKLVEGIVIGYNAKLITSFQRLKVCRDAYWKIAGDWEPDWTNKNQSKFVISIVNKKIEFNEYYFEQKILAFPTEEMRDAFFKNFKELIEICKELL